ncbi:MULTISPECIES: bifunctional 5,10-methylenetetrahydrofolate dehydrogenase/5,10-methenyltetrahydrofolate cyclohydrolase [Faecalibacterium]|uniref:bifunctional 5,10-methylenetetrahydrofolate dehydrogenase/5,10-methenyltetrahydrofolate cyclohydrolase n=1 Tax=Faecalibacterium TaxID=216851 RepID=UPI000E4C0CF6|nr:MULTISPECIES: bifunctional 5,10-methylenetetrahydrofolate dehydrogenase/5,10-methenyltetrahydrofolate cyclohydrolase [Faecalibacterium]RHQ27528.1 bifunctional 5,10-methylenetetrahydrofolate dehydrogenase/5,10-methenyltetrahydrofolate cyclohydrolase [Faecalibacterium sp. AF28-13AC]
MIIDCKSIAQDIKDKIKNIIAEADYAPILYIYQVGDNPASNAYIRGKLRDCEEVGIEAELIKLPENITEDELNNKILEDYNWEDVDGIIVQLPLPKHINPKNIYIPDAVDVDGFNTTSQFQPCTPLGVMKIFDSIGYDLDGKNVLVCGQSDIVGRPLVDMLIKRHCNVISVNSTGSAMKATAFEFGMVDVIISAVGKRDLITPLGLNRVEVCIDVGINYDENGKQHGDCADAVYGMEDIKVTPRIGGVGLMTRAMLLYNVCVAKYGEEKMEKVIE